MVERDGPASPAEDMGDARAFGVRGAAALGATLALAACGGGGDDGSTAAPPPPSAPVTVVPAALTAPQASRVLAQATNGATRAEIDRLIARGLDGWLSDQFATPRSGSHWDWLVSAGYAAVANQNGTAGWDPSIWRQLISAPDQLRQRVALALLDMLVVGIEGINLSWRQFAMAAYMDVLLDHAFGSFRALLGAVTTNAAMASFLTFLGNRKANAQGAVPDENYARELMQLFTLGLHQLNPDGTRKLGADGKPVETYGPADVSQLARVFTGLSLATGDNSTPDRLRLPLVMNAASNEAGSSTFLGVTVGGGGMAAIDAALDAIFAHPNVPPFVSRGLIQRLTTSNPSPGYVGRVAAAFADNGKGARGDLQAVARAILTDPEARSDAGLASAAAGKLRDPVQRFTGWARAFKANSPSGAWAVGNTSDPATRLGQSPGRSPSVFNFFRPGYSPPGGAVAAAGLVAPEFQITNEQSVIGYVNWMYGVVANGIGDVKADYSDMLAKASDAGALVDEANLLLAAGQLPPATLAIIRSAVESVSAAATNGPINRVGVAIMLTLASPDYLTAK